MKKNKRNKKSVDWMKVGTLFSIVATLIMVIFTYMQVTRYRGSNKADFAHRLKSDFFTPSQRDLIFLLNNDLLVFKEVQDTVKKLKFAYFSLNKKRAALFQNDTVKLLTNFKDYYSTYDIEDILLNHFEDLNMYRKKGIIDDDYIINGFSWYVELVYEHDQIQMFFKWLKSDDPESDAYQGVRELYEFVKEYKKLL